MGKRAWLQHNHAHHKTWLVLSRPQNGRLCHAHKMAASAVMMSVFRRDLFNGKVAVVTGGATGLGRAITEELTSLGCKVVIASRKLENLEETAKTINETLSPPLRPRVFPYQCNIRNEEQARNY